MFEKAKPADWLYHSSLVSMEHPFEIARMCVRQAMLDYTEGRVPYVADPVSNTIPTVNSTLRDYNDSSSVKLVKTKGNSHLCKSVCNVSCFSTSEPLQIIFFIL